MPSTLLATLYSVTFCGVDKGRRLVSDCEHRLGCDTEYWWIAVLKRSIWTGLHFSHICSDSFHSGCRYQWRWHSVPLSCWDRADCSTKAKLKAQIGWTIKGVLQGAREKKWRYLCGICFSANIYICVQETSGAFAPLCFVNWISIGGDCRLN